MNLGSTAVPAPVRDADGIRMIKDEDSEAFHLIRPFRLPDFRLSRR
jgi:hypothetical protein